MHRDNRFFLTFVGVFWNNADVPLADSQALTSQLLARPSSLRCLAAAYRTSPKPATLETHVTEDTGIGSRTEVAVKPAGGVFVIVFAYLLPSVPSISATFACGPPRSPGAPVVLPAYATFV